MQYTIYQLKDIHKAYAFMCWKFARNNGFSLDDYKEVYTGNISGVVDFKVLEGLFEKFNLNRPADFKGHSLSVSDVVKLKTRYYYCDSFGWKCIKGD